MAKLEALRRVHKSSQSTAHATDPGLLYRNVVAELDAAEWHHGVVAAVSRTTPCLATLWDLRWPNFERL
jgi:hypothetical protein